MKKRYISAAKAAKEIAEMDGKSSEEMGEEFQGTMAEYERYLICREQALNELPATATVEEIEDRISDWMHDYDLVFNDRPSLKLEQPKIVKRCQHRKPGRNR